MTNRIRFVHTNIVARDWKRLSQFYINVFNCKPVLPERDLKGDWLDKLTKLRGAYIQGIHLTLPGIDNGPTLEIFEYNQLDGKKKVPRINQPGFSHIAFHVDDVEETFQKVITHGGESYGKLVEKKFDKIGVLRVIYTKDPEGNIIEIQNWKQTNEK